MKVFSTFSGIGGFELGIKQVFPDWQIVGYSEVDKYAEAIYQFHFPECKNFGDITKIDIPALPDFDVLVGGVPCQAWSIAGKKGGFDDPRGKMWFYYLEMLKVKRPKIFIAENVKGLVMSSNTDSFLFLVEQMNKAGYYVDFDLFNSKDFGVPQNRQRIFIIGIREDLINGEYRTDTETNNFEGGQGFLFPPTGEEKYRVFEECFRERSTKKIFFEQTNERLLENKDKTGRGQSQAIVSRTIVTREGTQADNTFVAVVKNLTSKEPQSFRVYDIGGIAPTQQAGLGGCGRNTGLFLLDGDVRKLTPIECERVQGFPDNYTRFGRIAGKVSEISDGQRYKTLGNAVTVPKVAAIIEVFKNYNLLK